MKKIFGLVSIIFFTFVISFCATSSNKIEGFRMFTWNTPMSTVKSTGKEPMDTKIVQSKNGKEYTVLTSSGFFADILCKIEYYFHDNKLIGGQCIFFVKDKNIVERLVDELNKKHGNQFMDERDKEFITINPEELEELNKFEYFKGWWDLVNGRMVFLGDLGTNELKIVYTSMDNPGILSLQKNFSKSESWKIVKSWNGNGIKNTESFIITSNEWRIKWTNKGMLLQIYVYPKEESAFSLFDLPVNTTEPGSDVSYFHKPGEYYLTISAMGNWSVVVEEK